MVDVTGGERVLFELGVGVETVEVKVGVEEAVRDGAVYDTAKQFPHAGESNPVIVGTAAMSGKVGREENLL